MRVRLLIPAPLIAKSTAFRIFHSSTAPTPFIFKGLTSQPSVETLRTVAKNLGQKIGVPESIVGEGLARRYFLALNPLRPRIVQEATLLFLQSKETRLENVPHHDPLHQSFFALLGIAHVQNSPSGKSALLQALGFAVNDATLDALTAQLHFLTKNIETGLGEKQEPLATKPPESLPTGPKPFLLFSEEGRNLLMRSHIFLRQRKRWILGIYTGLAGPLLVVGGFYSLNLFEKILNVDSFWKSLGFLVGFMFFQLKIGMQIIRFSEKVFNHFNRGKEVFHKGQKLEIRQLELIQNLGRLVHSYPVRVILDAVDLLRRDEEFRSRLPLEKLRPQIEKALDFIGKTETLVQRIFSVEDLPTLEEQFQWEEEKRSLQWVFYSLTSTFTEVSEMISREREIKGGKI